MKCKDNFVDIVKEPIECYKGLHYLYVCLGIIFTEVFYIFIAISSIFYFSPFNNTKPTTKIDTLADSLLYFCKLIIVIRFIFFTNEYISIVLLLVASLFNLKKGFESPTYNNY